MSGEVERATPASWARTEAQITLYQDPEVFESLPEDERLLGRLDRDARDLDFLDEPYFVETGRGLAIPASYDAAKPVKYISFYNLTFEGTFRCYSKVMIERIIGHSSVRAYCLVFDEALLLPYFDYLPEDRLLYVPILAVESMHKTG